MEVKIITAENFNDEVINSDKPVLLDFWASWCGPCQMVGPIVEEIAEQNDSIKVGKVNVDEQMQLAVEFKVSSIPTLVVIKNGIVSAQAVGYRSKEQILSMLEI